MLWFVLTVIYLLITLNIAIDSTDYGQYSTTTKDFLFNWFISIIFVPATFLVLIGILKLFG